MHLQKWGANSVSLSRDVKPAEQEIVIIGQGLAGSSLALELEEQGIFPLVVDNQHHQAASKIAAGLWNPVSFRNMKTVWMASECLKINADKYPRWESKLQSSFYHPLKLIRIHRDAEETNNWDIAREKNPFLLPSNASAGSGEVSNCGWVNVPHFIHATAQYLKQEKRLIHDMVSREKIELYLQEGRKVILCTGYQAPWSWWPINPNKGEVLELNASHALKEMAHFSHFVIPLNDHHIKLGSTYQLEPTNMLPTPAGREELEKAFSNQFSQAYEVSAHLAGYRPTTGDRRPVLGRLSADQPLYILSGLGSRGVLMAPLLAQMLTQFLLNGTRIHPEADVARYLRKPSTNHKEQ